MKNLSDTMADTSETIFHARIKKNIQPTNNSIMTEIVRLNSVLSSQLTELKNIKLTSKQLQGKMDQLADMHHLLLKYQGFL